MSFDFDTVNENITESKKASLGDGLHRFFVLFSFFSKSSAFSISETGRSD
jgi:hypothetical protein